MPPRRAPSTPRITAAAAAAAAAAALPTIPEGTASVARPHSNSAISSMTTNGDGIGSSSSASSGGGGGAGSTGSGSAAGAGGAAAGGGGGGSGSGGEYVGMVPRDVDPSAYQMVLYDPYVSFVAERDLREPANRVGTTEAAAAAAAETAAAAAAAPTPEAAAAARQGALNNKALQLFLRLLLLGLVEVPALAGRAAITKILKTLADYTRTPGTLLEAIRTTSDLVSADLEYQYVVLERLRAAQKVRRPDVNIGTITKAIEALEAGLTSYMATFRMLSSFNEVTQRYKPLPLPQYSSGRQTLAAGANMETPDIGGYECTLLKNYMIFVYYIRMKGRIRARFAERWSSLPLEIRRQFEVEQPGLFARFLTMIGIGQQSGSTTGRLPSRQPSVHLVRGNPVTLISQNEMRLVNGIISNILQNEANCEDSGLKARFNQYLTMTEMDVAQIVPERKAEFEGYVQSLIADATGGASGPPSPLELALRPATAGRNVRGALNISAHKKAASAITAAEAAAAKREAAARVAAALASEEEATAASGGRLSTAGLAGAAAGRTFVDAVFLPGNAAAAAARGAKTLVSYATAPGRAAAAFTKGAKEGAIGALAKRVGDFNNVLPAGTNVLGPAGGRTGGGGGATTGSWTPYLTTLEAGAAGIRDARAAAAAAAAAAPLPAASSGGAGGGVPGWGGSPTPPPSLLASSSAGGLRGPGVRGSAAGSGGGVEGKNQRIAGGKRKAGNIEATPLTPEIAAGPNYLAVEGEGEVGEGDAEKKLRVFDPNGANGSQGGGYRRTRRAAKRHSRRHRIIHKKKQTRVNRKRVTRRR
jgi:hypothetical protein